MVNTRTLFLLVAAAAAAAAVVAPAGAQTHRARRHARVVIGYSGERPPLTVTKRSFLDPGPVVPMGSMSSYVTMNTVLNQTPDQVFARSEFGNERLPRRFEVPGRPQPVLEFATPGYPY